jgi:hypothetical protein
MGRDLLGELARVVGVKHPGDRGGADRGVSKQVHAEI